MAEQNKGPIKLSGGTVVKYDPDRLKIHPNADKPWMRYDPTGSGSLTLSMGTYATFKYLSTHKGQDPEPTLTELVIRRTEQGAFFELTLTDKKNPLAREFKIAGEGYRVLRDVNVQVQEAGLQSVPGTIYTMEVFEAKDDEYDDVIAANWSTAVASPRPEKSEGQAAKNQENKTQESKKQPAEVTGMKEQAAAGKQETAPEAPKGDGKTV